MLPCLQRENSSSSTSSSSTESTLSGSYSVPGWGNSCLLREGTAEQSSPHNQTPNLQPAVCVHSAPPRLIVPLCCCPGSCCSCHKTADKHTHNTLTC